MTRYPPDLPRPVTAATQKGAGDHSMSGVRPTGRKPLYASGGQGKVCTVNARLREVQTERGLTKAVTQQRLTRHDARQLRKAEPEEGIRQHRKAWFTPAARTASHREVKGRTDHLTTPHLTFRVNTGSPVRACLTRPVWRRSRHSSQTLGVTPETAAKPSADGRAYKGRATDPKALPVGGRGTASLVSNTPDGEPS